jgi:DNA-directed RNA polymerase subunit RPC12/RpoP
MELTVKHINTYQKLVDTIGLLPLCCGDCGEKVIAGEDDHNKVYLKCYSCNDKFYPGLRVEQIVFNALGISR